MTSKALSTILNKHAECTKSGNRFDVSKDTEAMLFVAFGSDSLSIGPLASVEIEDDTVVSSTQRGEKMVVLCEDVRALRIAARKKTDVF